VGRLGEAQLDTTPSRLRMVCLRLYSLLGIAGYAGLDGGLRAMGRSRGGAARRKPFGTAGRRPNRGCGPRAAAGAARHNITKPHQPRTYRDAGRERASGAASPSKCQAGASTSRCHWSRTRKESRAARGPEEQVQSRGPITPTSDMAELTVSTSIVISGHVYGFSKSSSNRYQSARDSSGMGHCRKRA
jgi:hypothetical protein